MNFQGRVWRYFNTLRYLKLSQIIYRLLRKVPVSFKVIDLVSCPDTRLNTCLVSAPIEYPRCIIDTCNFHFLNQNVKSDLATVWNCDELPKLWLYNLHYFNDLKSVGAEKRQDLLCGVHSKCNTRNGWIPPLVDYPINMMAGDSSSLSWCLHFK